MNRNTIRRMAQAVAATALAAAVLLAASVAGYLADLVTGGM